jgi:hypothetical protein
MVPAMVSCARWHPMPVATGTFLHLTRALVCSSFEALTSIGPVPAGSVDLPPASA